MSLTNSHPANLGRVGAGGANGADVHAKGVQRAAQRTYVLKEAYATHATEVSKETEGTYVTEVPQEPHETQVSEDSQESQDSQDTQDTTTAATTMATTAATTSQLIRKVLVELGRKYSRSTFDKRRAFQLASNVKAMEVVQGKFSFELRRLAFEAATEKIKPDRKFSLFAAYVSAFRTIKKPMKRNTIVTAQNNVACMGLRDLPEIPGYPLAGTAHKRMLALHQQMHALGGGNEYFLSRRALEEAAGVKLPRYEAQNFCVLLEEIGLIKIVDKGKPGKGQGKGAARYRYLGGDEIPF